MTTVIYERSSNTSAIAAVASSAARTPDEIGASLAHDGTSYVVLDAAPELDFPIEVYDFDPDAPDGLVVNTDRRAAHLRAVAAEERVARETGGVTIDGVPIGTSRDAQQKLDSERAAISDGDRPDPAPYLDATGEPVSYTNAEMTALVSAVRGYVRDVFNAAAQITSEIDAGDITTPDGVRNHSAWPNTDITTS